jgi:hypothetical protein
MNKPSEPILLYKGQLEIIQKFISSNIEINENTISALVYGEIKVCWFPRPCIRFEVFSKNQDDFSKIRAIDISRDNKTYIRILESSSILKIKISESNRNFQNTYNLSGRILVPVCEKFENEVNYSSFHLLNFNNYIGNIKFSLDDWLISIDQVENIDEKINLLNSQGGFLITHIGRLAKRDSQKFSVDEAKNFLMGDFKDSLSFARGLKVPVVGFRGYDDESQQVWSYWDLPFDSSWKSTDSWFPSSEASILAEVLPGFIQWLNQERDIAETALYSYLEANSNPILEIRIILIQAALETLSHTLTVDHTETSSRKKCKRLKAAEKMRKLCTELKIPIDLPPPSVPNKSLNRTQQLLEAGRPEPNPKLNHLVKAASEHSWTDGPHSITAIRNDIVHGKKRYDVSWEIMNDTANLGLWYLEMIFLAKAGYEGKYQNRLVRPRQYGEMELVPWSRRS